MALTSRDAAPRRRKALKKAPQTAGERLMRELSKPEDTFSVRLLIERAAHTVDWLDRCTDLLNGEQSEWMHVRLSSDQVLEVRVDNALRAALQLTAELRHLMTEIHRRRAAIPMGPTDDDDLAGL